MSKRYKKYKKMFEESSLRIPGIRVFEVSKRSGDIYVEALEDPALGQDPILEKVYTDALVWLDVSVVCEGEHYTVYSIPNLRLYLTIWSYKLLQR